MNIPSRMPGRCGALWLFFLLMVGAASVGAGTPARTGFCHAVDVNVRAGHGADFQKSTVFYTITKGDRIEILAEDQGWLKIRSPKAPKWAAGKDQWVMKQFVTVDEPAPTPDSADVPAARPIPTYFWADLEGGETLVDIVDPIDGIDLEKLAGKYTGGEGRYTPVPASETLLPKRFRVGDELPLMTENGLEMRRVIGFGVGPGASETHFYLRLKSASNQVGSCGILLPEVRSNQDRLRAPLPAPLPEKTRAAFYRRLGEELPRLVPPAKKEEGEESRSVKEALAKVTLDEKTVQVFQGTFPRTGALLVAIDHPIGDIDRLGFMALVTPEGEILESFGLSAFNGFDPLYLVDLDLDGYDEIVFCFHYYEGHTYELIRWVEGKPVRECMTGDGA